MSDHPVAIEVTNAAGRYVFSYTRTVWPANNDSPVVLNSPHAAPAGQPIQFSSARASDPEGDSL
jgi:hypothetical protein